MTLARVHLGNLRHAFITLAVSSALLQSQSLEQILDKHYKAMGGLKRIQAVKAARFAGSMAVPLGESRPPLEMPFTLGIKSPTSQYRLDFTAQGTNNAEAFDGKTGWRCLPITGVGDPQRMSDEESRACEFITDFAGPLVQSALKGYKVELLGKAAVGSRDAYKLQVTTKKGYAITCYLDAKTFLEFKEVAPFVLHGVEVDVDTVLGDFKAEGGVMLAHSLEMDFKGTAPDRKILIRSVELNPVLDYGRFAMSHASGAGPAANK